MNGRAMSGAKVNAKLDYWLVVFLVFISASPVFNNETVVKFSLPVFFLVVVFLTWKKISRDFVDRVIVYALPFFLVFVSQALYFELFQLAYISFFLKLVSGAVVFWFLGKRFGDIYFNVVFFLVLISFPLYILQLLTGPDSFPSFVNTFAPADNQKSILIHTVVITDHLRNAGFSWEPGAFQGFIILGLAFSSFNKLRVDLVYRIKFVILVIGVISTFSTSGYVCLAFVLLYKYLSFSREHLAKIVVVPLLLSVAVISYTNLDFLGQKITSQIEEAFVGEEFFGARFASVKFDSFYILENPVIGNGFVEETRWRFHPDFIGRNLGHGNGLTNFAVGVGLFATLFYFVFLALNLRMRERYYFTLLVLFLSLGQQFLLLPLFMGMPFYRSNDD